MVGLIGLGKGSGIPQIPDFAANYGISELLFFEGFDSIGTFDVNNTLAPGFNWYLNNFTTFEGQNISPIGPADPSWYDVINSILSVTSDPYSSDSIFSQSGYIPNTYVAGVSPQQVVRTLPLMSGAKPFYVEGSFQFYPTAHQVFWVMDESAVMRSINNGGPAGTFAEFDLFEVQTNVANQNWHAWSGP